jgi:WD40 repeat protein/Tfp pilus assembly protein PilF
MDALTTCARCRQPIPLDAPRGGCPRCLLRLALDSSLAAPEDTGAWLPDVAGESSTSLATLALNPTPEPRSSPAGDDRAEVPGYEILGELGRGGMGVVYKARHGALNRVVALKMILSAGHAGPGERARFRGEAEAVARLKHPNVVQVYDVGEVNGLPYISLEFVEGGTLDKKLAGATLPPHEAAALVEDLARALESAHAEGLVHRDLKPSNVLLTEDGTPKITDFGLAKKLDTAGQTASGAVLGTPSYMAPEQASGKPNEIGPAADVYALGATLYECLTGRPPFKAATALETLVQVMADEPAPPRQLNARTPVDLETICLKCLQKEAARRYGSAAELADDLHRYRQGQPILARPVGRWARAAKWVRRNPVVAAMTASVALLLLVLAVGASLTALWLGAERDKALAALDRAEKAEADALEQSRLARKAEQEGLERLWGSYLTQARAGRAGVQSGQRYNGLEVLSRAARIRPALALRNEAIACMALDDLREVDSQKGPTIDEVGAWACAVWSDEKGTVILRRHSDQAEVARLTGSLGKVIWSEPSPDGAFVAVLPGRRPNSFTVWDWRKQKAVLDVPHVRGHPWGWSATGRYLFALAGGDARVYDVLSGQPVRRVQLRALSPANRAALSPDGRRLALGSTEVGRLQVFDLEKGNLLVEWAHPGSVFALAWRRDGRRLASSSGHNAHIWNTQTNRHERSFSFNSHNILVFNRTGDVLAGCGWGGRTGLVDPRDGTPLVDLPGNFRGPFLGGDRWLTKLHENGRAPGEFYQVALARECRRLTDRGRDFSVAADFSPDGRLLTLGDHGGLALHDLAAGVEIGRLVIGSCTSALFSPAGDSLVTYSLGAGLQRWPVLRTAAPNKIVIGPPSDFGFRPIPSEYNWAALSRNGTVALTDRRGARAIILDSARPGRQLVLGPQRGPRSIAFSPDGKLVAMGNWGGEEVKVHEASTGRLIHSFGESASAMVAFSPCGKWLAISLPTESRTVAVGTWKTVLRLPRKEDWIAGPLAFSRDGMVLAICPTPTEVRLVHPATGKEIATLRASGQSNITALAFNRDGSALAVAQFQHTRLWDLRAVRRRLAEMQLDWDLPPYPPEARWDTSAPLSVRIDLGDLRNQAEKGRQYAQARQWENAAVAYVKAIGLLPEETSHHSQRNRICAWLAQQEEAFRKAIELRPNDGGLWLERGRYFARRGEWKKSAAAYARTVEKPITLDAYHVQIERAAVSLLAGDRQAYSSICALLRKAQDPEDDPEFTYILGRVCALAPLGKTDALDAAGFAEQALAGKSMSDDYRAAALHVRGLARYRAGQFDQAVADLEQSLATSPRWAGAFLNGPVLAMAHRRLGQDKEARRRLDESRTRLAQLQRALEKSLVGFPGTLHPADWLEWQLLLRDAETLFAAKKETPAAGKKP